MSFKWTRPAHIPYPSVWLRFKAKDVDTDDLVEYTVEDLPEDRFDEAIEVMAKGFLTDAPMPAAKNAIDDKDYVDDISRIWKLVVKQRMVHVCLKEGSQEIVGLHMSYVASPGDVSFFVDDSMIKSPKFKHNLRVIDILHNHEHFDVFEKYGVDKYLTSFGMFVSKKFSGRKIGEKLSLASKNMATLCDIKLRHAVFQSDISNKVADNLGYITDVALSFEEIKRIDPTLSLDNIKSSRVTLRTWIFDKEIEK